VLRVHARREQAGRAQVTAIDFAADRRKRRKLRRLKSQISIDKQIFRLSLKDRQRRKINAIVNEEARVLGDDVRVQALPRL
jgi:hypothetical protein